MLTYALFIATDPDPVSSSDWSHLDQVFDRARLSSGGTVVKVRATEGEGGTTAEDFEQYVATFVNGLQLEVRDDGLEAFSFLADGNVVGAAQLRDGQWELRRASASTEPGPVATASAGDHTREEAELRLGEVVEDWLN